MSRTCGCDRAGSIQPCAYFLEVVRIVPGVPPQVRSKSGNQEIRKSGGTHIDRTCGLSLLEQEKERGGDILWVVSIPSMCDLLCLNHLHTAHLKSTLTPVSRTHTSTTNYNYTITITITL